MAVAEPKHAPALVARDDWGDAQFSDDHPTNNPKAVFVLDITDVSREFIATGGVSSQFSQSIIPSTSGPSRHTRSGSSPSHSGFLAVPS